MKGGGKLACDLCGAVLSVPSDDSVLNVTCAHCQHVQLLPDADRRRAAQAEARERARQEGERQRMAHLHEHAVRSSSRMGLWITLGTFVFILLITAISAGPGLYQAWTAISAISGPLSAPPATPIPLSPPPPLAAPTPIQVVPMMPVQSATELAEAARTRVAGLMRARMQDGCRRVIMPPEIASGPKEMTAELVRNRQCIEILAIAGAPTNPLTLTMSTPFGEAIPPPAPSAEIQFRHCPDVAGPHPVRVSPATGDPYAIAALECPRRR